ncbi:MAG: reverse transcriptase domain-containing protein [Candidatus Thiodiazotropha sp.]
MHGFRTGRSQHNALDAIYIAVTQKRVSWILDADIQGFFDNLDHDWLLKFIQHWISDKRILRWVVVRRDSTATPNLASKMMI